MVWSNSMIGREWGSCQAIHIFWWGGSSKEGLNLMPVRRHRSPPGRSLGGLKLNSLIATLSPTSYSSPWNIFLQFFVCYPG